MVEVQIKSGMKLHELEVASGKRFEFGKNWSRFLALVDEDRIAKAASSLKNWLEVDDLNGKSFLDIGSGSGLYSLAARRLGARVHSFDYDPHSVACTSELKRRYFAGDLSWIVEEGSALDVDYLNRSGHSTSFTPGEYFTTPDRCGRRWITLVCRPRTAASCSSPSTTIRAARPRGGNGLSERITTCHGR